MAMLRRGKMAVGLLLVAVASYWTALAASAESAESAAAWASPSASLELMESVHAVDQLEAANRLALLLLFSREALREQLEETHAKANAQPQEEKAPGAATEDELQQGLAMTPQAFVRQFYPAFAQTAHDFGDFARFGVLEVSKTNQQQVLKRFPAASVMPALVLFNGVAKKNPYTDKWYREVSLAHTQTVLDTASKLRRLVKESLSNEHLTQLALSTKQPPMAQLDKLWQEPASKHKQLVLLISKQRKPSHLFRALSMEFVTKGFRFVFVKTNEDPASSTAPPQGSLAQLLSLQQVPSLVVMQSMHQFEVLNGDNMKNYQDLTEFVRKFVDENASASSEQTKRPVDANDLHRDAEKPTEPLFVTEEEFEKVITHHEVAWIVAFIPFGEDNYKQFEAQNDWVQVQTELQKQLGVVMFTAVKCQEQSEVCEKYGRKQGVVYRVFPLLDPASRAATTQDESGARPLPTVFENYNAAHEAAVDSIPTDNVQILSTSAEIQSFVSVARAREALPVLFFSKRDEVPDFFNAVSTWFEKYNVMYAMVSRPDEMIKKQFGMSAKASMGLACLVPTPPEELAKKEHPEEVTPYGIIKYEKRTMGAFNFLNIMRFLANVLHQYPHPKPGVEGEQDPEAAGAEGEIHGSELVEVPYLRQDNLATLCSGNKVCAIGFFENHVDTLSQDDSALAKSVAVLSRVATISKNAREPFEFMWTNGKCQQAFAEAFGVGLFQMPTIVVFSPSKHRFATNVGVFDESNTHDFLRSVLSGKIATSPLDSVPSLVDECSFEAIEMDAVPLEDDADEEDLDDLLSEIIQEEAKQRHVLEKELKAEQKASSKKKKSKKSKKAQKKTKDEL